MTRTTTVLTIAVLSSILTPVVVGATGMTQKTASVEPQARIETAAAQTPSTAEQPTCSRRVKVVYGGFAEAHAAACAAAGETTQH